MILRKFGRGGNVVAYLFQVIDKTTQIKQLKSSTLSEICDTTTTIPVAFILICIRLVRRGELVASVSSGFHA